MKSHNPSAPRSDRSLIPACVRACVPLCLLLPFLPGCSQLINHWREDGPAVTRVWESSTEVDIRSHYAPAPQLTRNWPDSAVTAVNGAVTHWPLYFEDPFVDKGSGNGPFDECGTGRDEYRIGWEDYVAMPYGYARHWANMLLLPVSAVVTPPWTVMESDGFLSRQALGYDHDAVPLKHAN